jgi:hypothetical protein
LIYYIEGIGGLSHPVDKLLIQQFSRDSSIIGLCLICGRATLVVGGVMAPAMIFLIFLFLFLVSCWHNMAPQIFFFPAPWPPNLLKKKIVFLSSPSHVFYKFFPFLFSLFPLVSLKLFLWCSKVNFMHLTLTFVWIITFLGWKQILGR